MRRPQLKRHLTYIQRVERLTGNDAPWIRDERGKNGKESWNKKRKKSFRLPFIRAIFRAGGAVPSGQEEYI